MRVVDDAVLAALEATGVNIHDGLMLPDLAGNPDRPVKITYDLPYAVFYSNIGDDDDENPRLIGRHTRRSVFFSLTIVGEDRWQVKWAGERIRTALQDTRLTIPGYRSWPIGLEESQRIRRDDDAIRSDGSPLFYGVDSYALSIALNHQGVLNG